MYSNIFRFIALGCGFSCLPVVNGKEYVIQVSPDVPVDVFLQRHQSLLNENQVKTFEFESFHGIYGEFTKSLMRGAYFDNIVTAISADRPFFIDSTDAPSPRHLAQLSSKESLGNNVNDLSYVYDEKSGIGVDIYILDTGIFQHDDFENRAVHGVDFTDEGSDDINGHGTYVAGLAGGLKYGVAKKSNIVNIKIADQSGRTTLVKLIQGLQYVSELAKVTGRQSIITIPFSGPKNQILNNAVEAIANQGISVVVSAGNEGDVACNYSPASSRGSIVVGAIDDRDHSIAPFSNWGSCVDVFTSGVDVESVTNINGGAIRRSGTSGAAAIGSGLLAYFLSMGFSQSDAMTKLRTEAPSRIAEYSLYSRPHSPNRVLYNGYDRMF